MADAQQRDAGFREYLESQRQRFVAASRRFDIADQTEIHVAVHLKADRHEAKSARVRHMGRVAALIPQNNSLFAAVGRLHNQIGLTAQIVHHLPQSRVFEIAAVRSLSQVRRRPKFDLLSGLFGHFVEDGAKRLLVHLQCHTPRRHEGSAFDARNEIVNAAANLSVGMTQC